MSTGDLSQIQLVAALVDHRNADDDPIRLGELGVESAPIGIVDGLFTNGTEAYYSPRGFVGEAVQQGTTR